MILHFLKRRDNSVIGSRQTVLAIHMGITQQFLRCRIVVADNQPYNFMFDGRLENWFQYLQTRL